jgi:transposase
MAKPYSQDLRDRVLDAVEKDGMSRRAAAARFEVSESSAIKWAERLERTGSRSAAQMGGYKPRKLDPHREFLEAAGRKSRTSRSGRFVTGFWPSAGSRPTPR